MMRRRASSLAGARGFTLLELLVATAVGAIVLLVINQTFFGALRLYNTTHARIDEDLVLQRTLGIVRKDLAGIMLPSSATNSSAATGGLSTVGTFSGQLQTDAASTTDLDGTGTRVTPDIYTTSASIDGWTPYSEVQMVSYFLTPATDGSDSKNLVRVVTRNLLPAQQTTTDDQVLLTGVASAEVLFYDGTDWTDTWDTLTTSTLPSAIKFSLTMANHVATQGMPGTIDLVVPVLVTTTTSAQLAAAATTP